MKKFHAILLVSCCFALAGLAEAADKPKKRTRNQNRVGPYASALVGMTNYTGDQLANEQTIIAILDANGIAYQNLDLSTDDSDFGYQLAFGYRFHRHFAGELSFAQFGELSSKATGDLDFGGGFEPSELEYSFHIGGPIFSVVGILPAGEHFEAYARVGYLFASVERELTSRVSGQSGGGISAKGDSQNLVYGGGFAWNINQVYSIRAEYQKLEDVGQSSRTGTEDLDVLSLGMVMRF